ncbi:MAG: type I restriction endonuclease subunit R, partial [Spirochaetales bacterium]|nr:type I restriction endonuclease subunit R [Spirochaetales bacterium]
DHNLFQAICRVNRTNGEQKEFGYIIDYRGLFKFIEGAIEDYTNGQNGVENFDKEDIQELLKSRLQCAREELEKALERVARICDPVELPKKEDNFYDYFCFPYDTPADEQEALIIRNAGKREDFYNAVMCLNRRYAAIAMEMVEAGYSDEQAQAIYTKVKDYEELRHAIMQRSGDYVDMKKYDAQMRALLDRYIIAPRSEKLESLDNFSFLDIIQIDENGEVKGVDESAERELGGMRGVAETMTANVRSVINRKRERNPEEYKKFSERINRLLTELQAGTIEYRKFLQEIKLLSDELRQGNTSDARLDNAAKKDLCDNLGGNVELALRVYETAKQYALPHFRENPMIYKQLKRKIAAELLGEPYDADVVTLIIKSHTEEF